MQYKRHAAARGMRLYFMGFFATLWCKVPGESIRKKISELLQSERCSLGRTMESPALSAGLFPPPYVP